MRLTQEYCTMKNLMNLDGIKALSKEEQKTINGGSHAMEGCPTYPASACLACGGYPLPNGCCLGTEETHCCLSGNCP